MDTSAAALLQDIRDYCEMAKIKPSTFGQQAVGDWTLVERLERGRVTLRIMERAQKFIAERRADKSKLSRRKVA